MPGHSEMVDLLLKHGADPNEQGAKRITPLMWAAIAHRSSIVPTSLAAGADANAKDQFGYTSLRHAGDIRYSEAQPGVLLKRATRNTAPGEPPPGR